MSMADLTYGTPSHLLALTPSNVHAGQRRQMQMESETRLVAFPSPLQMTKSLLVEA